MTMIGVTCYCYCHYLLLTAACPSHILIQMHIDDTYPHIPHTLTSHTLTYPTQVILLSATMPMDVLDVTKRFMREPIRILVKKEELTLEGIRQFYIQVEKEVCGSGHPSF